MSWIYCYSLWYYHQAFHGRNSSWLQALSVLPQEEQGRSTTISSNFGFQLNPSSNAATSADLGTSASARFVLDGMPRSCMETMLLPCIGWTSYSRAGSWADSGFCMVTRRGLWSRPESRLPPPPPSALFDDLAQEGFLDHYYDCQPSTITIPYNYKYKNIIYTS